VNIPTNIHEITTDDVVPRISQPVWWDTTLPVARNLGRIEMWMGYYRDRVPAGTVFDEAAILVPDPLHQERLGYYLHAAGWEKFNVSEDLVFTNPFGTRYFVEYSFYRHPAYPYRLEVMMMGAGSEDGVRGFSPLHSALWTPNGHPNEPRQDITRYPVPHISYKPKRKYKADPELGQEYDKQTWGQAYSQAIQYLKDKACIHAMTCQSTYGRFGYYLGNDVGRQIYVKPRVNIRDECGQPAPCGHAPDGGNHPVVA
jgi:hypothetical protein